MIAIVLQDYSDYLLSGFAYGAAVCRRRDQQRVLAWRDRPAHKRRGAVPHEREVPNRRSTPCEYSEYPM